jgi:hypothetical protein
MYLSYIDLILPYKEFAMVLHAQAEQGTGGWIISLINGSASCILATFQDEPAAKEYTLQVNGLVIAKQQELLSRLDSTQKILFQILAAAGVSPRNNEEIAMALIKVLRYIELGKKNAA